MVVTLGFVAWPNRPPWLDQLALVLLGVVVLGVVVSYVLRQVGSWREDAQDLVRGSSSGDPDTDQSLSERLAESGSLHIEILGFDIAIRNERRTGGEGQSDRYVLIFLDIPGIDPDLFVRARDEERSPREYPPLGVREIRFEEPALHPRFVVEVDDEKLARHLFDEQVRARILGLRDIVDLMVFGGILTLRRRIDEPGLEQDVAILTAVATRISENAKAHPGGAGSK